ELLQRHARRLAVGAPDRGGVRLERRQLLEHRAALRGEPRLREQRIQAASGEQRGGAARGVSLERAAVQLDRAARLPQAFFVDEPGFVEELDAERDVLEALG